MELRHLRYFVAVVEERSISRAAERLVMSQPALTRQIKELERECGIDLLERVPRGVHPTPAGTALYQHAAHLLGLAAVTRDVARSASAARELISIGLPPGLPADWLTGLIHTFRNETPDIRIEFSDANSSAQLRSVQEGRLDIGLVHQNPPSNLHSIELFEKPFGLAVRPNHPLAERDTCPLVELDNLRVLAHAREQIPAEHDRLISVAYEAGIAPIWQFASFVENALACAEVTGSHAVLLSEASAHRLLPGWPWVELVEPAFPMRTWLVRPEQARSAVETGGEVIARYARRVNEPVPAAEGRGT
ncbi:LysR family transcriptional regulator [Nocardia carnea]|uniref:LysR family transcriptional regulator n=1 Tax=Nocardia carnea TaxID=37328 RepID=UPI0024578E0B|nr:LysR family transcriptional regulator [Nocardia carnea]